MNENYCKLTTIRSELKEGTKTVYQELERQEEIINQEHYNNCINATPFFRRLGGSETVQKEYTSQGYIPTRIISKSPNRKMKTERIFNFNY